MQQMPNNNFLLSEADGWICALAPAKVNLFLHITGRRENGYHEIESVFAFTKFGDKVRVRPDDKLSLKITGEFGHLLNQENLDGNLVIKAALALKEYVGRDDLGAEIVLEKNLPIAAGIGGGSSDAAATLRALIRLWNVEIPKADLMSLALELGADVPACLHPQTSFVSGIGEQVKEITLPANYGCVLVNSGHELSTAQVFKLYSEMNVEFSQTINDVGLCASEKWLVDVARNDLLASAVKACPEVEVVLQTFERFDQAILSRMSGSGATCFTLTKTMADAKLLAETLQSEHPSWWVQATEFV